MTDRIDDVLAFRFDELAPKAWWSAAPDVDARVRERFASLLATLTAAPPDRHALDARALGDRDALREAERHRATIDRFGRFPARNAALARESTSDEAAFLREGERKDREGDQAASSTRGSPRSAAS